MAMTNTYKSNGGVTLPKAAGKVLPDLRQVEDALLKAEIERLKAENAALKQNKAKVGLKLQVSEKRGVMLLGLRKFPITFYKAEWETILGIADQIKAFIAAHDSELSQGRGE
jgi:hypothetical protein